tara:strand:+ start:8 stop:208 length:201 start_codon:yes stop_codon:yes gene_type:complete
LSLNRFIKKTCVEIKNIKGNISKISDGEFNSDRYRGKRGSVSISLKNSISDKILSMKTKLNIIKNT